MYACMYVHMYIHIVHIYMYTHIYIEHVLRYAHVSCACFLQYKVSVLPSLRCRMERCVGTRSAAKTSRSAISRSKTVKIGVLRLQTR